MTAGNSNGYLRTALLVLPTLLLAALFFLETARDAEAQSRTNICRNLSSQLNALGNSRASGGNSAQYRKFNTAVRKQENQITRAKRALRRNGCVGFLSNSRSQCRGINNSLKKMQANLRSLKQQRAKHAPKSANTSLQRRRILAAMRRNRCGTESRQANVGSESKSRRRTLLEQVFGVRTYNDDGRQQQQQEDTGADRAIGARYGTYRTLCVRKSDGYYFPISFSTVKDRFDTDEETCRNMCPSSEVALYVHRMPNEDSEDMISYRTEVPYSQEPFAFAYRKSHNPENQCRFSVAGINQSVDAPATGEVEKTEKVIRIGIPNFRKDPTQAPDEYDNVAAAFDAQDIKDYYAAIEARKNADDQQIVAGDRKVRIVGPAFFPVQ